MAKVWVIEEVELGPNGEEICRTEVDREPSIAEAQSFAKGYESGLLNWRWSLYDHRGWRVLQHEAIPENRITLQIRMQEI